MQVTKIYDRETTMYDRCCKEFRATRHNANVPFGSYKQKFPCMSELALDIHCDESVQNMLSGDKMGSREADDAGDID